MDPQTAPHRTYSLARPIGATVAESNHGWKELTRLAAQWIAGAAGVISGFFEYPPAPVRSPAIPRITARPIKPPPPEALPLLSQAIVGSSKFTIASVLGAPRSAVIEGLASIEASETGAFYQTDTWYYPLPRHGQIAMAVTFAGDVARHVEFFHAPRSIKRG